jgi:trehalose-6-phosphatase
MWLRRRRQRVAEQAASLPAVRTERALVALAVHAQQIEQRLERMEARIDRTREEIVAEARDHALEAVTQDDLLEVQVHSAKLAAEVSRLAVELRAQIDDLAVQLPPLIESSRRNERAQVFAESILELSDGIDTSPLDLRTEPGGWAATA